jgi:16S rRNA (cytidine1402-2'-O)-methyltransferase
MSTLFLVATPIGNLEDITLRALRVLREVPLIAAEDTRSARLLLRHHGIDAPKITSYTDHNASAKTPQLLRALDEGDVALVSDAGMPGISDPGHHLIAAAVGAGHDIVPVPGASAVLAAVAASGLPSRRFYYLGFLPKQSGPRRRALTEAAASGDTVVVFESPHRLRAMLADALAALGDRRIAACRELTKRYEEIWRGTISEALSHFSAPRGEFTLVIEGDTPSTYGSGRRNRGASAALDAARDVQTSIARLRASDTTSRDAVAALMRTHSLSRRDAYRLWHRNHVAAEL